jgi:glycosyltransferase
MSVKVSIVTVVYNNVDTIRDAVESVIHQNYDSINHIIIDGGSDDGTLDVLEEYKTHFAKFVSEPDDGIFNAMNKGISYAEGDIVGILNSDDYYKDNTIIKKIVKEFKSQNVDAVYGDLQYVTSNGNDIVRQWNAGAFEISRFKNGWMPPHPTLFVKRDIYDKYGTFDEEYDIAADYELVLRFLYKNKLTAAYIPEVLVKMREGGNSNGGFKTRINAFIEDYKAWKQNGFESLPGLKAQILKRITKLDQFLPWLHGN